MARTTTRAQMIAGMMLEELRVILDHLPEWSPVVVDDKDESQLMKDPDYMRAGNIVSALLIREINKNEARLQGSYAGTLGEIDEITMTEA